MENKIRSAQSVFRASSAARCLYQISAVVALIAAPAVSFAQEKVLRVAPNADLRVLDPHATAATVTHMHALMIYDTLYAMDESFQPQPQMVGAEKISEDGKTVELTLRPGLKFHDGSPVAAADVVASLKRWIARDSNGKVIGERTVAIEAISDDTVKIQLSEPFPALKFYLAATSTSMAVIMREEEAATPPFELVTETIGSGPFVFAKDKWISGAKVVYERNPDYVPRDEAPSGYAGGKIAKVDAVEFHILPDSSTKSAALQAGEIDFIDQLSYNHAPILDPIPEINVGPITLWDSYGILRFNHLYPPFDNVKVREAVAMMINQEDYLAAAYSEWNTWQKCYSFFVCGTPNGTEKGSEAYQTPDMEKAKQLLKDSGYNGEKVVIISSHDLDNIGALYDVAIENLKEIGFNLEVAESDWGSLITRRANQSPPDQGGWNLFITTQPGAAVLSPLTNALTDQTCGGKSYLGWPCDEQAVALRTEYRNATTAEEQKDALERLHVRTWETLPNALLGQFTTLYAWRDNVTGLVRSPSAAIAFWNVEVN